MSTVQILLTIQITLLSKNNHLYLYQWFCKYSSSMRFHHQQHSKHINGPRPIIRTDDSNCPRKFFRVTNEPTDTRQYPCQLTGSRYPMSNATKSVTTHRQLVEPINLSQHPMDRRTDAQQYPCQHTGSGFPMSSVTKSVMSNRYFADHSNPSQYPMDRRTDEQTPNSTPVSTQSHNVLCPKSLNLYNQSPLCRSQ